MQRFVNVSMHSYICVGRFVCMACVKLKKVSNNSINSIKLDALLSHILSKDILSYTFNCNIFFLEKESVFAEMVQKKPSKFLDNFLILFIYDHIRFFSKRFSYSRFMRISFE